VRHCTKNITGGGILEIRKKGNMSSSQKVTNEDHKHSYHQRWAPTMKIKSIKHIFGNPV
jgi:hypothetical protein